jgi:four helix bundle protein
VSSDQGPVIGGQNRKSNPNQMSLQSYRDLIAWQKAIDLAETVYQTTGQFPKRETYGLTSQIRRAAVSIPSNIAEGQGRRSTKDFLNFLGIAYGSLCELETQILLAIRFAYIDQATADKLFRDAAEVGRLMNGLMRSLDEKSPN